ncbi:MAG: hypothetical protein OXI53_10750 [Nitrospira sp.]|nr:hypothetical protein [Nitrospira sp.]
MNPPERFSSDDPREWMNRARSNMAEAKMTLARCCWRVNRDGSDEESTGYPRHY